MFYSKKKNTKPFLFTHPKKCGRRQDTAILRQIMNCHINIHGLSLSPLWFQDKNIYYYYVLFLFSFFCLFVVVVGLTKLLSKKKKKKLYPCLLSIFSFFFCLKLQKGRIILKKGRGTQQQGKNRYSWKDPPHVLVFPQEPQTNSQLVFFLIQSSKLFISLFNSLHYYFNNPRNESRIGLRAIQPSNYTKPSLIHVQ